MVGSRGWWGSKGWWGQGCRGGGLGVVEVKGWWGLRGGGSRVGV